MQLLPQYDLEYFRYNPECIDFREVCRKYILPEHVIEEFFNSIFLGDIVVHQKLSPEFIDKHFHELNFSTNLQRDLFFFQEVPEEIIQKYSNDVKEIGALTQNISPKLFDFLSNRMQHFYSLDIINNIKTHRITGIGKDRYCKLCNTGIDRLKFYDCNAVLMERILK